MFVELGMFINEKNLYNQKVNEIKNTIINESELSRILEEEKVKFKGITRKYLPTALSVIKNTFKCEYSLYKVGRDVDANFNTIETNVNKTQTEVASEMNQFVQQANSMALTAEQINKLNLAIDVIMNYIDDTALIEDETKTFYLNHSKVVASSFDLPVTQKKQDETTMYHNPYANQPLNLNNLDHSNLETVDDSKKVLVDPFASIYNGSIVNLNNPYQVETSSSGYQVPANNVYQAVNQPRYIQPQQNDNPNDTMPFQPYVQSVQNAQVVPSSVPNGLQSQTVFAQNNSTVVTPIVSSQQNIMTTYANKVANTGQNRGEKVYVKGQLLVAILIPIMLALSIIAYYYLMKIDFVVELLSELPSTLNTVIPYLILFFLCWLFTEPIIKIARSKTMYVGRFMIAPSLLSMPISYLLLKAISSIEITDYENMLILNSLLLLGLTLYFPFVTLLFLRASSSNSNNSEIAPKWMLFEKIGMLASLYIFILPGLYVIFSVLKTILEIEMTFFDEFMKVIYFMDNPNISSKLSDIFLIASLIISILIMFFRTRFQKRVGNNK